MDKITLEQLPNVGGGWILNFMHPTELIIVFVLHTAKVKKLSVSAQNKIKKIVKGKYKRNCKLNSLFDYDYNCCPYLLNRVNGLNDRLWFVVYPKNVVKQIQFDMQTFILNYNYTETMRILDSQRLNKQLLESLQIAQHLTGERLLRTFNPDASYKNHPVVNMWKPYLKSFFVYMLANSNELINRDLAIGSKMHSAVECFGEIVKDKPLINPKWLDNNFIQSHRQALLYKSLIKLRIYIYSRSNNISINRVTSEIEFQEECKGLFATLDHAPQLTSSKIASNAMCNTAAYIYNNYYENFKPIYPLNINYR